MRSSRLASRSHNIDTDIRNYTTDEIFKMFGLSINTPITHQILLKIKKKVLLYHPDKSDCDPDVFDFYYSAYRVIKKIYNLNLTSESVSDTYSSRVESNSVQPPQPQSQHSRKFDIDEFNRKYNENHEVEDNGYGEWFTSPTSPINASNKRFTSKTDRDAEFERLRERSSALSVKHDIAPIEHRANGVLIESSGIDNYSSGIFGSNNLCYQDLKQAYTETVIPVSTAQYNAMPKYSSIDEYKKHNLSVPKDQQRREGDQTHRFMTEYADNRFKQNTSR